MATSDLGDGAGWGFAEVLILLGLRGREFVSVVDAGVIRMRLVRIAKFWRFDVDSIALAKGCLANRGSADSTGVRVNVWDLGNDLAKLRGEEKTRLDLSVRRLEFDPFFRCACCACGCGLGVDLNVWGVDGRAGARASDDDDFGEVNFFVRGAWLELGAGVLLLLLGKGASFEDEFAEPWGVWERFGELGVSGGWVLGADGVGIACGLLREVCGRGRLEAGLKSGTYIGFGTR